MRAPTRLPPHFDEKDISVNIDKGALIIQAERREKEEDKKKKYVIRESSSSFYRSITLPEQAAEQRITAPFDDGVLKVTVPLKELTAPTNIAIGTGQTSIKDPARVLIWGMGDSARKMMSAIRESPDGALSAYVKGAPESIVADVEGPTAFRARAEGPGFRRLRASTLRA